MIFSLLRVVGIAVAGHGGRILSAGLPFGPILFDIAKEAFHDWRRSKKEKECIAEIEAVAQAAQEEIRRQSAEVAREEGRELTDDSKLALSLYLSMIPASIKQSLRRPSDPTGTTIPRDMGMSEPQDLLRLLPNQLPRFKPGDRPLPGVDWELVELLGVGGFGEVWKAKHPDFDGVPPVALKFCLDEDARDRLLRHEAAILNQVMRQGAHPGIVTLQHTYLRADPPCLEYELIEGGSLVSLITHEQGSPNRALELIAELARTLAFTHRQNPPVVHRDLKPANILIANENGQSVLKIADFGIGAVAARQALDEATRQPTTQSLFMTNVVRGAYTPLYASPQQQRGDDADPRDDVYSLGVIWYQLLTGDLRRGAPSGIAWMRDLSAKGISQKQIHLLASCIEEEPQNRPASAAELTTELTRILNPPPPAPTPRRRRESPRVAVVEPVPVEVIEPAPVQRIPPTPPDTPSRPGYGKYLFGLALLFLLFLGSIGTGAFAFIEQGSASRRASYYWGELCEEDMQGGRVSRLYSRARTWYTYYRRQRREMEQLLIGSCIAAGLLLFLLYIVWTRWLFLLWSSVQDGRASMSPGKAVGLLFIPIFNFYWIFRALGGLSTELNRVAERRGITDVRVNPDSASRASLWTILSAVPGVDLITIIPAFVMMLLLLSSMSRVAKRLA